LFEVVFCFHKKQRVPQRPKQNKNTRVSVKQYNQRGKFFASLSCLLKKDSRLKPLGFVKQKRISKRSNAKLKIK
jgi:hypothetical protein